MGEFSRRNSQCRAIEHAQHRDRKQRMHEAKSEVAGDERRLEVNHFNDLESPLLRRALQLFLVVREEVSFPARRELPLLMLRGIAELREARQRGTKVVVVRS